MYLSATLNGSNVSVVDIKNVGATQYITYLDSLGNLNVFRGLISNTGSVFTSGISIVNQGTSGSFIGGSVSAASVLDYDPYLPLSGGTVSGSLYVSGTTTLGTLNGILKGTSGIVSVATSSDIPALPYSPISAGGQYPSIIYLSAYTSAVSGSFVGQLASIPQLIGTDQCILQWTGSRWSVLAGQKLIHATGINGSGYPITATSTAYTTLVSTTIPGGICAPGEEWISSIKYINTSIISGSDVAKLHIGGATVTNTLGIGTSGYGARAESILMIKSTTCNNIVRNTTSVGPLPDTAVNFSSPVSWDAGVTPGTSGNVGVLYACSFGKDG